jgi:hypothetical protein
MMGNDRDSGSIFGNSSNPVLAFHDKNAQAECARKFDLPTSSWWILGFTALVTVLAVVTALAT